MGDLGKTRAHTLIEQYLPFAASIACKIRKGLSSDTDHEEVLCNARLGLLEAAHRFDESYNVDFKTFAYYRIKGAIYDGLRKAGWFPPSLYAKMKFERAAADYLQTVTEKIAQSTEAVQNEVDTIHEAVNSLASIYVMSFDGMEDFDVEDKGAQREIQHEAEFQSIKERMREAVEELPPKERQVIKMYYFQNKTLEEIGAVYKLSKSWTSRLHSRALEMLLKKLSGFGEGDFRREDLALEVEDEYAGTRAISLSMMGRVPAF